MVHCPVDTVHYSNKARSGWLKGPKRKTRRWELLPDTAVASRPSDFGPLFPGIRKEGCRVRARIGRGLCEARAWKTTSLWASESPNFRREQVQNIERGVHMYYVFLILAGWIRVRIRWGHSVGGLSDSVPLPSARASNSKLGFNWAPSGRRKRP